MSKRKKIIKWSIISIVALVIAVVSFGYWFMSLLPAPTVSKEELAATQPTDLPYLTEDLVPNRGKILAVVTSASTMGDTEKSTGYELTELARAYYVFQANGYDVDIASPQGGLPPVVIDKGDMKEFDYAFLNDREAQRKVQKTIHVADVDSTMYEAIYFVGGKGAMFDFPDNEHIQSLIRTFYEGDKVIGAVCHGPAALVNVMLSDGQPLLQNKQVSCFTSEEELFLIPDAETIFPFLLDAKITERGGQMAKGTMYLKQVSVDGNLVTGQNPWSTWESAESVIRALGHPVKPRTLSPEEHSVSILGTYDKHGIEEARKLTNVLCSQDPYAIDREMLAIHSIVSTMQWDFRKSAHLIGLLRSSNTFLE